MILNCKNCNRKWEYNGKASYYATCPNCLYKVKIQKIKKKDSD